MKFDMARALAICIVCMVASCAEKTNKAPYVDQTGYGVLIVAVQNEKGVPIDKATVEVINKDEEAIIAHTKSDGKIKGEASVTEGPLIIRVSAAGYKQSDVYGIYLSELYPKEITVVLQNKDQ